MELLMSLSRVFSCTRRVSLVALFKHLSCTFQVFLNEACYLAKFSHPRIVTLLGVCPEKLQLVCEYMHGGSLAERMATDNGRNRLPLRNRVRIMLDVASALAYIHKVRHYVGRQVVLWV